MNVKIICLTDKLELVDLGITLNRMGKIVLSAERAQRSGHLQRALSVGAAKVEPVNNRQQPPPNYRRIQAAPKQQGTAPNPTLDITPLVGLLQSIHQEITLLRKEVESHGVQLKSIRTNLEGSQSDSLTQTKDLVAAIKSGLSGMVVRPEKVNLPNSFERAREEVFIPTRILQDSNLTADISLSSQVSEDSGLDDITAALKAARKKRK